MMDFEASDKRNLCVGDDDGNLNVKGLNSCEEKHLIQM